MTTTMPKYRCHKEVWALKIKGIEPDTRNGGVIVIPEESGYQWFRLDEEFTSRHNPQPGNYYVVYQDGYQSISPAEAFESGYTRI